MKRHIVIFTLFFGLLFFFASCAKEETEPQMDLNKIQASAITTPAAGMQYVLDRTMADSVFTEFIWSAAAYPLNTIPETLYALECALSGTEFASVYELGSTSDLMLTITQGKVNDAIVSFIGGEFPADTVIGLDFRVKAGINANDVSAATDAYSAVINADVTPYLDEVIIEYPSLWVPGNHQGWAPATAPQIWDADGDNIFEGFVYFPEDGFNGEFKFTANPDWVDDENYGAGADPGTLDNDSEAGNLLIPEFGGYYLTVDLNAMTWTYLAQSWGVIGSGILTGDWSADVDLLPATGGPLNILEATVDVISPPDNSELRFKFRANNGWTLNYGANEGSNVLVFEGADIPMPEGPGNYTFKMNMSQPVFTYELIMN